MLLYTKLNAPKSILDTINRKRLIDILNRGINSSLTLITAPAGSGKSILVRDWLAKDEHPYVWFSLDESDNDLRVFLSYLLAGFQNIKEGFGESIESALSPSNEFVVNNLLIELINEINCFSGPVIVVLDDYHLINSEEIHDALSFILRHYHPKLRLVIVSRTHIPFPIQKLKIKNQYREIGYEEMRFQDDEIQALYKENLNREMSLEEAHLVGQKTEGWIAAIQLFSSAILNESKTDLSSAISGDKKPISQYLMEEITNEIPEEVIDFLKQTAVLNQFSLPLCNHFITPAAKGVFDTNEEIIEFLLKNNLFIFPLDNDYKWFRYHNLFKDFLLSQSRHTGCEEPIYQQASDWYYQNDMIEESINYGLKCGDQESGLQRLEAFILSRLKSEGIISLSHWRNKISHKNLPRFPLLSLLLALEDFQHRLTDLKCQYYIDIAKNRSREMPDHPVDTHIGLLEGWIQLRKYMVVDTGDRNLEQSISVLEVCQDQYSKFLICYAYLLAFVQAYNNGRDIDEVEQYLHRCKSYAKKNGQLVALQHITAYEVHFHISSGKPSAGLFALNDCIDYVRHERAGLKKPRSKFIVDPSFDLFYCRLYYSQNQLTKAKHHIEKCYNTLIESWMDNHVPKELDLSLIELAMGNRKAALSILKTTLESTPKKNISVFFPTAIIPVLRTCFIFLNAYPEIDWIRKAVQTMMVFIRLEKAKLSAHAASVVNLLEARWMVYQDKVDQAEAHLDGFIPVPITNHSIEFQMSYLLLMARIKYRKKEEQSAADSLEKALVLGEKDKIIRAVVDEGPIPFRIIEWHSNWTVSKEYIRSLQSAFKSSFPNRNSSITVNQERVFDNSLVESLNKQEVTILDAMRRALPDKQIAAEMNYSFHTVRSYIKTIYGKLDAHNRQEAINKANALGYLNA